MSNSLATETLHDFIGLAAALSDPTRVRALLALRSGELCVCQLVDLLGLAPSSTSRHMAILHRAGLVRGRRDRRWVYYRRAGGDAPAPVRDALAWVDAAAGGTTEARQDRDSLSRIPARSSGAACQPPGEKP